MTVGVKITLRCGEIVYLTDTNTTPEKQQARYTEMFNEMFSGKLLVNMGVNAVNIIPVASIARIEIIEKKE